MQLKEIKELLYADIICGEERLDIEIHMAGASDLMSDVLAFGKPGILLLTGLSNAQSVRTADIIEAKAIVYVRGKKPTKEGIDLAKKRKIPILSTNYMMYMACGILYSRGLSGVSDLQHRQG
jgi:predicted transcriptional regulator